MHKVFLSAMLLLAGVFFLAACGGNNDDERQEVTLENVRLAFIHVGDTADRGYTYRQHAGTVAMAAELGINMDTQIRNWWNISPGDPATTAIEEAIEWGADMVFATSFGHGPMMLEAARNNPNVSFHHATGDLAADANLPNFHNYFGDMSQARFLSGIAAGYRTVTNNLGFVAAHPNSEVITGLTAFFLGARSVNPDVQMYVMFMGQWNNPTLERQIAEALIAQHNVDVLGQHADSPTTQTVAQENGVWSVGYNNCVIAEAPNATLIAPMFAWEIYLSYAVRTFVDRGFAAIRTDVLYGWQDGMVVLSDPNPNTVVPNTMQTIAAAEARIVGGWDVFTGPLYGYRRAADGSWSDTLEQLVAPGVVWTADRAALAPAWGHRLEGINFLALP